MNKHIINLELHDNHLIFLNMQNLTRTRNTIILTITSAYV